jgi:hypothetical protein
LIDVEKRIIEAKNRHNRFLKELGLPELLWVIDEFYYGLNEAVLFALQPWNRPLITPTI